MDRRHMRPAGPLIIQAYKLMQFYITILLSFQFKYGSGVPLFSESRGKAGERSCQVIQPFGPGDCKARHR